MILRFSTKSKQEAATYYLEAITILLAKIDLIYIIVLLIVCSFVEIIMVIKLYKLVTNNKEDNKEDNKEVYELNLNNV